MTQKFINIPYKRSSLNLEIGEIVEVGGETYEVKSIHVDESGQEIELYKREEETVELGN